MKEEGLEYPRAGVNRQLELPDAGFLERTVYT